jgi:predicted site-specific integrase-resolvase
MMTTSEKMDLLLEMVSGITDAIMTAEQVAEMIHCEPPTVIQYAKSGELIGVKRHRWLFKRSDVMRFVSTPAGRRLAAAIYRIQSNKQAM